jgi:hypothetical protein
MTTYLDDFLNHCSVHEVDSFIVVNYNNPEPEIDDVVMEYDSSDGRLYVDRSFLKTFVSWFPLDIEQTNSFIKDWFEDTFKVKIKYVES